MSECRVCLCEHSAEVHSATANVHRWLRQRMLRLFAPAPQPERRAPAPGLRLSVCGLALPTPSERKRASRLGARGLREKRGK